MLPPRAVSVAAGGTAMSKTISSLYLKEGTPTYVTGIDPITILPGAGYVYSGSALLLTAGAPWYLVNAGTLVDTVIVGAALAAPASTAAVTIVNSGTVEGGSNAILMGGSSADLLVNSGTIYSPHRGVSFTDGTLINSGTIHGAFGGVALNAGTLINSGTISGGNYAVGGGGTLAEAVVAEPGAVFQGLVSGNYGYKGNTAASVLAFAAGTAGGVGTFAGLGSQYIEFSSVEVAAGADWVAAGSSNLPAVFGTITSAGLGLHLLGTLDNTGIIDTATTSRIAGNITVAGPGALLLNSGTIDGGTYGTPIYLQAGEVSNAAGGTIETAVPVGIDVTGGGTILDAGTINAGGSGFGIDLVPTAANQASTIAVQPHGFIYGRKAIYYVGSGAGGAQLDITVDAGGTVDGAGNGIKIRSGNSGYARVTNAGTIIGGGGGIVMAATNYGVVTNLAGGLVEGSAGISTNTVVNAGTIIGTAGEAVSLSNSGARLVVDPGAVFGGIAAAAVTASANLEFAVGTAAGTFAGLGSQYTGFATTTIDPGAAWSANGANTLAAGYTLLDQGALTIAGTLAGPGTVSLAAGITLDVASTGTLAAPVTGLAGGTIELAGTAATYGALSGGMLTLTGGPTLAVPGLAYARVSQANSNTYITACFASGTKIQGELGPVPVEALRQGDRVLTASGRLAPVRWLGHRRTDLARHPNPHDVMPVRVRAGAFADAAPARDLILSTDHAVFVEGRLVPIRHLVNGVSIVQETRPAITYWHVELDRHDIILAEGMPCESFLDTGNRCAFDNAPGAVAMTPDFARAVWAAEGCAPILTDPAHPALRALHLRLLARAHARAHANDPHPQPSSPPSRAHQLHGSVRT